MSNAREYTPKQLHFCRCVASGMSQSDAYREAYSTANMTAKTVNEKASRLMAQDKIRARVDMLVAQHEKAMVRSAVSTKTKVLAQLEHFMHEAEPSDGVRLRATELLGKSVGLFKEVIEDNSGRSRSSTELRDELRQRLDELLGQPTADEDDKSAERLN